MAIGSFAVYRLIQVEFIVALVDALLVAAMLGSVAYAWKTGRSTLAGNLIATLLAVVGSGYPQQCPYANLLPISAEDSS